MQFLDIGNWLKKDEERFLFPLGSKLKCGQDVRASVGEEGI